MFKYHVVRSYKGPSRFATREDGLKKLLFFSRDFKVLSDLRISNTAVNFKGLRRLVS